MPFGNTLPPFRTTAARGIKKGLPSDGKPFSYVDALVYHIEPTELMFVVTMMMVMQRYSVHLFVYLVAKL